MFSLVYGLWKYMTSKTEFHVLILGIDKSGKTVIFHLFWSMHTFFSKVIYALCFVMASD